MEKCVYQPYEYRNNSVDKLFLQQMLVNAFNILDQEMNSIGTGIYLGVSITDHNCTPNAVATFDGTTIFVRVIEDLPRLDWSKVMSQTSVK